MSGPAPTPIAERFWHGIDITDGDCWEWPASKVAGGYRQIWVGSRSDGSRRRRLAHVVAYETFVGDVPDGLELDHLCMNAACVNPDHLEAVTHQLNIDRRYGRA